MKCEPDACLIAEARGPIYQCDGQCAYAKPSLRELIESDSYAMTFQSLGQYRTALLKALDTETDARAALIEVMADIDSCKDRVLQASTRAQVMSVIQKGN